MLSRLVLGTYSFSRIPTKECINILKKYSDAGGLWIDTASFYGNGMVEKILGKFIVHHKPNVKIATKIGYFPNISKYRDKKSLQKVLRQSITRLRKMPDLIFVHEADWKIWWGNGIMPGELVTEEEIEEKDIPIWDFLLETATKYNVDIGISGNHAKILGKIATRLNVRYILIAKQYDLLWKAAECALQSAKLEGRSVWCAAPFHQGGLFNLPSLRHTAHQANDLDMVSSIDRLTALLNCSGLTIQQLAIPFLLTDTRIASVVFGVDSVSQLVQALSSAKQDVDHRLCSEILPIRLNRQP